MTLESVAMVAIGGAVFLVVAYCALETWLRAWEQQVPSPLVRTLYRVGADPERLSDFLVGAAVRDQLGHLGLPRRQVAERARGAGDENMTTHREGFRWRGARL